MCAAFLRSVRSVTAFSNARGSAAAPDARVGRAQVKTLDGKTHIYAVQAGLTVAELKAMVSKDTGVAVNLQRIIFRGKVHLPNPAYPHPFAALPRLRSYADNRHSQLVSTMPSDT